MQLDDMRSAINRMNDEQVQYQCMHSVYICIVVQYIKRFEKEYRTVSRGYTSSTLGLVLPNLFQQVAVKFFNSEIVNLVTNVFGQMQR